MDSGAKNNIKKYYKTEMPRYFVSIGFLDTRFQSQLKATSHHHQWNEKKNSVACDTNFMR